jgi:serine/threonine protein kinase
MLVSSNDQGLTRVKLADFGTAARMGLLTTIAGRDIGTRLFRSPEAFLGLRWGPPIDI